MARGAAAAAATVFGGIAAAASLGFLFYFLGATMAWYRSVAFSELLFAAAAAGGVLEVRSWLHPWLSQGRGDGFAELSASSGSLLFFSALAVLLWSAG